MRLRLLLLINFILFSNAIPSPLHIREVPDEFSKVDAPYNQLYGLKFQDARQTPVAAWPSLAAVNAGETLSIKEVLEVTDAGDSGSFFVRGSTAIYHCQFPGLIPSPAEPPPPMKCVLLCAFAADSSRKMLAIQGFGTPLWFTTTEFSFCSSSATPESISSFKMGAINALAFDQSSFAVLIAADAGLFDGQLKNSSSINISLAHRPDHLVDGSSCKAVSVAAALTVTSDIAVGWNCSQFGLIERFQAQRGTWLHQFTPGLIDTAPSSLSFDSQYNLWMADDIVSFQPSTSRSLFRLGARQGLPRNNAHLISASMSSSSVWVGLKERGVLRYDSEEKQWKALAGGRWLPGALSGEVDSSEFWQGHHVRSICALSGLSNVRGPLTGQPINEAVVVATDTGIAIIIGEQMTLSLKAKMYEGQMHFHDRLGLGFTSDAWLAQFGNVSSYFDKSTDNDGLHTSGYLLAEAYRFAISADEDAHQRGMKAFNALKLLHQVTPIDGLVARSVAIGKIPNVGGEWVEAHLNGTKFFWKANVSSDEIDGHVSGFSLAYALLARNDQERELIRHPMLDMVYYIATHNWTMIDFNGKRTRWGFWTPSYLNSDWSVEDERTLNGGAEILSYIQGTLAMLQDDPIQQKNGSYFNEQWEMAIDQGCGFNMENTLVQNPHDAAFFDTHLALVSLRTLLYFYYGQAGSSAAVNENMNRGIQQWFPMGRAARVPEIIHFYALWYLVSGGDGAESPFEPLDDAYAALKDYPVDMIEYNVYNDDRWDIVWNKEYTEADGLQLLDPLPRDETCVYKWSDSPFPATATDGHGGQLGKRLANPADFLRSYYFARYHGFIK